MTVPVNDGRIVHIGDGTTDTYTYDFRVQEAAELAVYQTDVSGVQPKLQLGVDYTVQGAGSGNGGSVVLVAGNLTTGYTLACIREMDVKQPTNLRNLGAFSPETHETAFDRLTMLVQQLSTVVGISGSDSRVMRLVDGDTDGSTVALPLSQLWIRSPGTALPRRSRSRKPR